ncbi:MAG: carbohydrate-binding domain-containing protein [Bacteroidaceae bacterium]|nr:carbohydrate-binding domain-containing protein [Bacteroidaceae bacterium]
MKKLILSIALLSATLSAAVAQTLNVVTGDVTYQFPAADAGIMPYTSGTSLTIEQKTFAISDITRMYVDATEVDSTTVSVVYDGASAKVYVAGDIAHLVDATIAGAHVKVAQSTDVADEITYSLSGSSSDGEFYMAGSYKATVELRGLTLTNATPVYSGAAVCIMNGKRIDLSVKSGTTNALTDCSSPSSDLAQKAALYCKGHLELKGQGTLTAHGKYAHAIKSAEYMTLKNATINVASAVKDGISCDEYFLMKSGTLTISGVGDDGLQCDLDGTENTGILAGHDGEDSGNIYIEGGTLDITTTAAGGKCIKADSTLIISGGTLTLSASGSVDTSDSSDPSYSTTLKGGKVIINGGFIKATVSGTAGRGVAAWDIETNGGELNITNSAGGTTVSSDVKCAKGMKALNMALNAGTITINMSGAGGTGIRAGYGEKSSSGGGSNPWGGGRPGPGGGGPGGMGRGSTWTNIKGNYTQGLSDGSGPAITVNTTGSTYSTSEAKAIRAICAINVYGGTTEVTTTKSGAEGMESKSNITIKGGKHYFKCYDDCINSAAKIIFDGGITVCYSNGNDAVDSNLGSAGAITIGNGICFAYTTRGAPEEGFDCDNNSYIQITGTGVGISAGGAQGGGSSSNTISGAAQGYAFYTSTVSYQPNRYYTLTDANGSSNLITYSFEASCNSSLALFTAKGMVKGSTYAVKYATTAPTDAATVWHGLYVGSSTVGSSTAIKTITAK